MSSIENSEVAAVYASYPDAVGGRLLELRALILAVGNGLGEIGGVQETLKWGEPSYSTVAGSTVRLGWSKRSPDTFGIYFHCQSKLVSTFRQLYPDTFRFEGNRAILFKMDEDIPAKEVAHCVELALCYHKRKHLPLLGAGA